MIDQNSENNWGPMQWRRRKFWKIVLVIVAILLIIGLFHHHEGYSSTDQNAHTISVSGHGEVFAAPNIATFTFSSMGQAATVSEAQDKMTKTVNAAIDYLKKGGVDAKDIQTSDYSVNPTYKYGSEACLIGQPCPPSGTPTITGYEVTETVTVKLRDLSKSSGILAGIGSIGVSNISGLNFTIDNPDALKEQARKMAIDQAKAEANQLAKDLGVHLKGVVSFNESGNTPGPIPYALKAANAPAGGGAATPTIEPGQNKITSDVTITYDIR